MQVEDQDPEASQRTEGAGLVAGANEEQSGLVHHASGRVKRTCVPFPNSLSMMSSPP